MYIYINNLKGMNFLFLAQNKYNKKVKSIKQLHLHDI